MFKWDCESCVTKRRLFLVTKMNYEAERAMNQKRLRMEGEPGHGVVQGNGLPLNYIGTCCIVGVVVFGRREKADECVCCR